MEIRNSLSESIKLTKPEAIKHLQIRLEPAVLVNDDVTTKRYVYRTILTVLNALGLAHQLQPGISIVETTIDTLFNVTTFPVVNKQVKELYKIMLTAGQADHRTRPLSPKQPIIHNTLVPFHRPRPTIQGRTHLEIQYHVSYQAYLTPFVTLPTGSQAITIAT